MAGASTFLLTACGSSTPDRAGSPDGSAAPVLLVDGSPTAVVVRLPDGSGRRLDGPALDAVLSPARPLAAFKTVEDAGDDYGFTSPAFVVVFEVGSRPVTVLLGRRTFDGEGVYARRCGDPGVHLVTLTFFGVVERIATEGRPDPGPEAGC